MRTAVLERMDVQEVLGVPLASKEIGETEIQDGRAELAERAAKELGYKVLQRQIEQDEMKVINTQEQILTERKVLQTLFEIGPDAIPFKPESVEKYKKKMESKDMPFLYRHGIEHKASDVLRVIFLFATLVSFIATGVYTGLLLYGHHWLYVLLCAVVGLTITFGFFMIFGLAHDSYSYRRSAGWRRDRLSECNDMVPEFALETALSVDEKLPEAEFFVESFVKGWKEGCPFLGITCKGRDYYLEVWNEPGFKAKRLA